ncbi:hypothetical protein ACIGXA_34040 [Streptomyces fildesensis]|uniref:Uncharacterized protein n=1 Tax=Streptomyces fildesensis TaxID=375757 RepID=A0ABW8CIA2_9ACTN
MVDEVVGKDKAVTMAEPMPPLALVMSATFWAVSAAVVSFMLTPHFLRLIGTAQASDRSRHTRRDSGDHSHGPADR